MKHFVSYILHHIGYVCTVFILFYTLSGCVTQRRCTEKFPPQISSDTFIKDSVRTETKYRDTTIYIPIPGKVVHDSIPIPIPCPEAKKIVSDTIRTETEFAIAKAWIEGDELHIELEQKDTSYKADIKNAIRERDYYKYLYEKSNTKQVQIVKHVPLFWRIAGWIGISFVIGFCVFLYVKIKT
jgi:hypothetical protein